MSIVVTGGAGFIGSCLVRMLNDRGIDDIYIVDEINSSIKWKNLLGKRFITYIHKDEFLSYVAKIEGLTHIIHLGACSSTTECDFDYLWKNNVEYSKRLYQLCVERNISFIYASSAATYGDGSLGFYDDCALELLRPLNRYGYSKNIFDIWVAHQSSKPKQCVGLKFFNVYGPNEYHKGNMISMVNQGFKQALETGKIRLFKSYKKDVPDGMQSRDFVYVKDVCDVIYFFIRNEDKTGLFNVGTGNARSFNDLARSVFKAMGIPSDIEYVDMPDEIRAHYQYKTEAVLTNLRKAGYSEKFSELEQGVDDYIKNYLLQDKYY